MCESAHETLSSSYHRMILYTNTERRPNDQRVQSQIVRVRRQIHSTSNECSYVSVFARRKPLNNAHWDDLSFACQSRLTRYVATICVDSFQNVLLYFMSIGYLIYIGITRHSMCAPDMMALQRWHYFILPLAVLKSIIDPRSFFSWTAQYSLNQQSVRCTLVYNTYSVFTFIDQFLCMPLSRFSIGLYGKETVVQKERFRTQWRGNRTTITKRVEEKTNKKKQNMNNNNKTFEMSYFLEWAIFLVDLVCLIHIHK